jgi:DNA polymerase III epsilon subunit family exonuclease
MALIFDETFMVLDLETTGFSPKHDRITEIGAVMCCQDEVFAEFHTLVNPGKPIPAKVVEIVGITDDMVVDAPSPEQALTDYVAWVQEWAEDAAVFVSHSTFDQRFLDASLGRHGLVVDFSSVVDTLALAKKFITVEDIGNHKLAQLAAFYGYVPDRQHRAMDDAKAAAHLLYAIVREFHLERLEDFEL